MMSDKGNALTIHQMVEHIADQSPHYIAIVDENTKYDYKTLNAKANQLAHTLIAFGIKPDDIVAIALDACPTLIIGILAILKAGCAYLPIDAKHPPDRLQFLLENANAPILITHSQSKEKFESYLGRTLFIDLIEKEIFNQPITNPSINVKPENLAYVIYTSGSTGKPKGVLIEHRSVVNYINWFASFSDCLAQERIDFSSSIIFDMAVTTTITALALGLIIVICSETIKKNANEYLSHLQRHKINICKLTPSYFKVLIQATKNHYVPLPDLKAILLGGELLLTKDCLAWLEIYPQHILFNEYGPTEATVAISQFKFTQENSAKLGTIVPIGQPGFNMHCLLLNENNQPVKAGEVGELHVGGKCLARGYLNQKTLTQKKFIDKISQAETPSRFYKTGDLCRYLEDGNIEYLKRIDDQVKIRGYRIEPGEIEACLTSHPLVKESAILAQENSRGESQLIAYYIAKYEDNIPRQHELRAFLRKKIADYMLPTSLVMMKAFPLTENGKLDKKAFPKFEIDHEVVMPQTRIQHQLIHIWRKEFHLQNIGIKSNFFELGGHSLIAIRMISEIEKHFKKKISLEDLYKAPTIFQLGKIIRTAAPSHHEDDRQFFVKLNGQSVPLGDFQFIFWISNLFEPQVKKLNVISRRRIAGRLDVKALSTALEWLFKKHEILISHVGTYLPTLHKNKNTSYQIMEEDLHKYSENEAERKLLASLNGLINHPLWRRNKPLISLKLFLLKHNISEVQISVSHMGFDDASEELLFSDLSEAYLHVKNKTKLPSIQNVQYKDYIVYERNHLNQHLERDIHFWQQYLHDTHLVVLPEQEIVQDMKNNSYSTYLEMPTEIIEHSHQICTVASVSITDLLCAAISLGLKQSVETYNNNIFMNIIRSVRDNDLHDNMIGCFLRLDPIKVPLKTNLCLLELAKAIQQSRIDTEPYQACSSMVKTACLDKTYPKKKFQNLFAKIFTKLYCKLFPSLKLNSTVLMMYGRLNALRTKQQFMININLFNNFISPKDNTTLFGHKLEKIEHYQYDLSKINNVLDICIFRHEALAKNYLVISGNLRPEYRQALGQEIIEVIRNS